jgi:hypothetical protein
MPGFFEVLCLNCRAERRVRLTGASKPGARHSVLRCFRCKRLLEHVDTSLWHPWLARQVQAASVLQATGKLGTRRQAPQQTEEDIAYDGLAAELAACVLLCPGYLSLWAADRERGTSNRGHDLAPEWTGLDKPLEIKQTRHHSQRRGYLIVRPPRWTPGPMKVNYIDDSYYALVHGGPHIFELDGWTDRDHFLREGQLNPVPLFDRQRECWGIHWSKLRPMASLFAAISP